MAGARRAGALLAVALVFAAALPGPAAAADPPARFVVLQAAYYSFGQAAPTNQSADQRVVLLEQTSPAEGTLRDLQHNASDALLANRTSDELVVVEFQMPLGSNPLSAPSVADRFGTYYKADLVPTTIVDGTRRVVAFANNSPETFASTFASAAAVPAAASIRAEGGIVLGFGHLDVEAAATVDLAGALTFVHAILVEDPVHSPVDDRELRYVARASLGALRLVDGHAEGRFNFTIDGGWIESRLGVALFVQSDGQTEGTPPPGPEPDGPDYLLEVAPLIMIGTLAGLIAWFILRSRAAGR